VNVPPGMALHVLRSLYGLKQAARDWNQKCTGVLLDMGFVQSQADPCLFLHPDKKLIILVYVDDVSMAAPKGTDSIAWFKEEFGKIFKIKDLGEAQKILGVKVTRDRAKGTLRLDQTHYVNEVLGDLQMAKDGSFPLLTPMDSNVDLKPAGPDDKRANKLDYQHRIGKWMYLGILTRPDLSFTLGRLSQYLADPADFHMAAVKKLGKYIRGSKDLGIVFQQSGQPCLEGFSDSDYANDKVTRTSILGNVFFLAGGPVSWSSKKQKSVATSTTEAEYMAMCSCAKQSQWLAQILRDMGMHHLIGENSSKPLVKESLQHMESSPVKLHGDNQASLALVRDAQVSERSKHIDVAYHFVRRLWQMRKILVEFVGTAEMKADGFTKAKTGASMQKFVGQLNLRG